MCAENFLIPSLIVLYIVFSQTCSFWFFHNENFVYNPPNFDQVKSRDATLRASGRRQRGDKTTELCRQQRSANPHLLCINKAEKNPGIVSFPSPFQKKNNADAGILCRYVIG